MSRDADGAPARAAAAQAVHAVVQDGRNLDQALQAATEKIHDPRSRAQAQSLAYEALRWHCRHRRVIEALLDKPLRARDRILEALLSVGIQELVTGRAPGYAVVSANVNATRLLGRPRATGLVNASLRRFQREQESLLANVDEHEDARYGYPNWMIDALRQDWPEDWQRILEAGQLRAPMWLRVNLDRTVRDALLSRFADAGIDAQALDGLPAALKLARPMPVEDLPGFESGEVSVQDAAAQFAAALLQPARGTRVLDACAAPGGKSGHLLEAAQGEIDLVALDVDPQRLERVESNLSRLDYPARIVAGDLCAPEDWWDGRAFDAILLDVPCSASGVIRRHPDIRFLRRPEDLPGLATRQLQMLKTAWSLLRDGGRLLYATCSVFRQENQHVMADFLDNHPDARELHSSNPALENLAANAAPGHQILPGTADTDGFYYALIEKQAA